jgi:hypothetical protein
MGVRTIPGSIALTRPGVSRNRSPQPWSAPLLHVLAELTTVVVVTRARVTKANMVNAAKF